MVDKNVISKIELLAANIRRDVVMMIGCDGHTGHLGGSFSSAEIVAVLYGYKMQFQAQNPEWKDRDKFIYSKGHAAIAQYAVMAEVGYFPKDELWNVKKLGSMLQGHPDRCKTPGIEAGTGSLGQGLSIANGLALAMRLDGSKRNVYCILGDGELAEGQVWEAAMAAAHYKLDNVVAIVDKNHLQASGAVESTLNTNPLPEKWESFGWHVIEVDGHDVEQLIGALDEADRSAGQPTVVIANTVKGKGVSFTENQVSFHNAALTKEQYAVAIRELNEQILRLECGGAE